MPRLQRSLTRTVLASVLTSALAAVGVWMLSRSGSADAASVGQLQQQISAGQGRISSLSGAVSTASGQLAQLNGRIGGLQGQIARIQADLDRKRAELLALRTQLDAARARLAQLEAFQARAEAVLARQLVNSYETPRPDLMSVVLEARGFNDLLERLAFAQTIRKQDVHVVSDVRAARRAVAAQATQLGALEVRQQQLTNEVLAQRNTLARARLALVQQQLSVEQARAGKASELARVQGQVSGLQGQLNQILAAQAAAANPSGSSVGSGQISSSGGFTFPFPKGAASPPGTWTPDQGVDIAAPGGTPELAVCSGTIVLHGIGGFGPWAPVLHCDSSVGGYSYVYYGHAGPANQLPDGTHVSAGQVMSEVGPGIVGISTGPHIEIGFCDSSGTPIGPQTAGTMMSLLQASYGG